MAKAERTMLIQETKDQVLKAQMPPGLRARWHSEWGDGGFVLVVVDLVKLSHGGEKRKGGEYPTVESGGWILESHDGETGQDVREGRVWEVGFLVGLISRCQ